MPGKFPGHVFLFGVYFLSISRPKAISGVITGIWRICSAKAIANTIFSSRGNRFHKIKVLMINVLHKLSDGIYESCLRGYDGCDAKKP